MVRRIAYYVKIADMFGYVIERQVQDSALNARSITLVQTSGSKRADAMKFDNADDAMTYARHMATKDAAAATRLDFPVKVENTRQTMVAVEIG